MEEIQIMFKIFKFVNVKLSREVCVHNISVCNEDNMLIEEIRLIFVTTLPENRLTF